MRRSRAFARCSSKSCRTSSTSAGGRRWAPIGATNDPTQLNSNWYRNVSRYYAELGGDAALGRKIFYERNKQAAYLTDSTKGTTPIYQEIPNLSAAKSAYGNIVYNKAPAFLRQALRYSPYSTSAPSSGACGRSEKAGRDFGRDGAPHLHLTSTKYFEAITDEAFLATKVFPVLPVGPEGPLEPAGPGAPAGPATPCTPGSPRGPGGPCTPCTPVGPAGPCAPTSP